MPVFPPDPIEARVAQPPRDVMALTPRQIAESDWATQQEWARRNRVIAEQAAAAAEQRVQDQRFLDAVTQNARVGSAEKAVTAALKFQGMRGFERDRAAAIASGLSEEQASLQALSRNAGRMFADSPGDIAPSLRMLQPPRSVGASNGIPPHVFAQGRPFFPPAGSMREPFDARLVTLPDGTELVQTGPNTHQFKPQTGPKFADEVSSYRLQAQTLLSELNTLGVSPERQQAIRKELSDIREAVKKLRPQPSAQPKVSGYLPTEAPIQAPVVPSPAAGATPVSGPDFPPQRKPGVDYSKGMTKVRVKSTGEIKWYPTSMIRDVEGDDRYELVKTK